MHDNKSHETHGEIHALREKNEKHVQDNTKLRSDLEKMHNQKENTKHVNKKAIQLLATKQTQRQKQQKIAELHTITIDGIEENKQLEQENKSLKEELAQYKTRQRQTQNIYRESLEELEKKYPGSTILFCKNRSL
jgi:regulator of replication initiation timing